MGHEENLEPILTKKALSLIILMALIFFFVMYLGLTYGVHLTGGGTP